MKRFLGLVSLLFGVLVQGSFAAEEVLKSVEILFKAEISQMHLEWGRDEGDGIIETNLAFTGLQVKLLGFEAKDGKPIDGELHDYLDSNQENLHVVFDDRVTSNTNKYKTLMKYRKMFGMGIKGEVLVSGKINLKKVRKTVPTGSSGVEEKVLIIPEVDMFAYREGEKFTIEGAWSVVAEKSISVPFTATLNKAYHGRRVKRHYFWFIPDYEPCFYQLVVDLKSWENSQDPDFDNWLEEEKKDLKMEISKAWRYSDIYDSLDLYQNARKKEFKDQVALSGELHLTHVTLKNNQTKMGIYAVVNEVNGPRDVVKTVTQKVRVISNLTRIHKSIRDIFDEDTEDVEVAIQAKGFEPEDGKELHKEFRRYLLEEVFEENHICVLENSYNNSSIRAIKAHKGGFFNSDVRGEVQVLFDLTFKKSTFANDSTETNYRYEIDAVKGSLGSYREEEFQNLKGMHEAKQTAIFHTLYSR